MCVLASRHTSARVLAGLPTRGHVPASQTASARALAGQPTHGHVPASQTVHARAPAGQTMRGHVPASQPTVARGPASQITRGHVLASLPTPAHGQAGSVACGRDSAGRPAAGREIVYFYSVKMRVRVRTERLKCFRYSSKKYVRLPPCELGWKKWTCPWGVSAGMQCVHNVIISCL